MTVLRRYVLRLLPLCLLLQLKPLAWMAYGPSNFFVLRRNLTIRSTFKPYGLIDFQLLERKVLLDAGVTVTYRDIVLQNIRCACEVWELSAAAECYSSCRSSGSVCYLLWVCVDRCWISLAGAIRHVVPAASAYPST
jgi:hypothetical protein